MAKRRLVIRYPGRTLEMPKKSGCSYCLEGSDPVSIDQYDAALRGGTIRSLPTICDECVQVCKTMLCSLKWRRARLGFFGEQPYCTNCQCRGHYVPAEQLDHIREWRLLPSLFWVSSNWQGLCIPCHAAKSRGELLYVQSQKMLN